MTAHPILPNSNAVQLGTGSYTVHEAARLLREKPRNIRRWLGGYAFSRTGAATQMPPLWISQLQIDGHLELGFRDLIELRFVVAFVRAGLGLQTIRNCLTRARDIIGVDRPFSTGLFRTDGRSIFLESLRTDGGELLDLKRKQYVFRDVVEQTFKDLDLQEGEVTQWRPYGGRPSIVLDPQRSFGQPIASASGVPTATLADAAEVEGSAERAAFLYDVSVPVLRDVLAFEHQLRAA